MKISFFILCCFLIFNCSSGEDTPPSPTDLIKANLSAGNWSISNFTNAGVDETSNYAGYVFKFNNNGSIVVTKNAETVNGNYSLRTETHSSGFPVNYLTLNFSSPPIFQNINSTAWDVYGNSSSEISLRMDPNSNLRFTN